MEAAGYAIHKKAYLGTLVQIKGMARVIVFFLLFFPVGVGLYGQTARYKFKRKETVSIPESLEETSGLFYFNGHLFTFNDSGGENRLFQLDTFGGPSPLSFPVTGAINRDWEAATLSGDKLYIGDFGNNSGTRQDLTIYILNHSFLEGEALTLDSIRFRYPEQTTFEKRKRDHDFDCEAMVVFRDTVYLYSKSWGSGITHIRTLPAVPGEHLTQERGSFDAGGLITDATFNEARHTLVLVGYNLDSQILKPFVWIFETSHPARLVNGTRIDLGPDFTQIEGVTYLSDGRLAISAEGIANKWLDIAPALFLVWPQEMLGK